MVARPVRYSNPLCMVTSASQGPAEHGRVRTGAKPAWAVAQLERSAHVERPAAGVVHGRKNDGLAVRQTLCGQRVDRKIRGRRPTRPDRHVQAYPDAVDLGHTAARTGWR